MNPSQKQAIEAKAEELYKIKESAFRDVDIIINISKARFIEGATFGLSLNEKELQKANAINDLLKEIGKLKSEQISIRDKLIKYYKNTYE